MRIVCSLVWILIVGVMLNGCTSMLWSGNSAKAYSYQFHVAQSDALLGVAKLSSHREVGRGRYASVGKEQVYVLTGGNETISQILALVKKPEALTLVTPKHKTLNLSLVDPNMDPNQVNRFVGRIQFEYVLPVGESTRDWEQLPDYLIKQRHNQTVVQTSVRIFVHPYPLKNRGRLSTPIPLGDQYQIAMGSYEQKTYVDVIQVLNNAVATPFTLAADLITIPLKVVNDGMNQAIY